MTASDIANWWDKQKRANDKVLKDWVHDNPQWWTVGIAATVQSSVDLGSGFVDVLRLGEGSAEGGWGFGKDALRLLVILGPLGRAGGAANRFLTPLARSGRLRFAYQVNGVSGPCTFQAVNNATRLVTGKNMFFTVSDMAAAVGKKIGTLPKLSSGQHQLGTWMDDLVPFLQQSGMRVKEVAKLESVEQVAQLAQREAGPVVFAIRTTVQNASGATQELLHSVIAMRSATGGVRYADYGGKFVSSLQKLVGKWGTPTAGIELAQSGSSATVIGGVQITGQWAMKLAKGAAVVLQGLAAIETDENGVEMAVPVTMGAAYTPADDEPVESDVVKNSFESFAARKRGAPVRRAPANVIASSSKSAPRAEYLTGVQFRLNALGFGAGWVDGKMGPRTRKAVRAFQDAYPPLRVDGIPGPNTQASLAEECGY